MQVTKLKIMGMTCEGCNIDVQQVLLSVPDVEQVTMDARAGSALITHEGVP